MVANFPKRLIRLREERGLKRQAVADNLEISRSSLEHYEKGSRNPDIFVLKKIADFYEVNVDFLLHGTESKNIDIKKELGLSNEATESLKKMNNDLLNTEAVGILNILLGSCYSNGGLGLLSYLENLKNHYEAFERFVNSDEFTEYDVYTTLYNDIGDIDILDFDMANILWGVGLSEEYQEKRNTLLTNSVESKKHCAWIFEMERKIGFAKYECEKSVRTLIDRFYNSTFNPNETSVIDFKHKLRLRKGR
jgi:transcriptional regulator with XRE-family HTH domain